MPNRQRRNTRSVLFASRVYSTSKGRSLISIALVAILALVLPTTGLFTLPLPIVKADSSAQTVPFSQNWSNNALITANDNWSGVPGIEGYLGQDITTGTGTNPQLLLGTSALANDLDVIANQSAPNTLANGGVAEFDGIADRTIALNGSGTADAPYVIFYLNTTGMENINVAYDLRDLDGSTDDAIQQVALHYRVGSTGSFTNVPAAYVSDATTGPSLATKVTSISVPLPAAVANQPVVQVRVMTTNAVGNDEWVGVDNISITGTVISNATNPSGAGNANPNSVAVGDSTILTVAVTPGENPASTAHTVTANLSAIGGSMTQQFFNDGTNGDQTSGDNVFTFTATIANGTSGGAKILNATIQETAPQSRTGSANINLTVLAPTNPTGTGSANPNSVPAGTMTLLTVNVTPGANPTSTGISVAADLTSIGGSAVQAFNDDGGNVFSYTATVAPATAPGPKSLPVSILDAQNRTGNTNIALTVAPPPPTHVVISQVYGGGGNAGAPYNRDFVELYNPHNVTFDLTGWSLQYTSATGDSWEFTTQPLGGTIGPGEYLLVALASGATGAALPAPNISGSINMSATTGKVALVSNFDPLVGSCPIVDPDLVDFVGYGTGANCAEGLNAPAPSNANAIFRKNGGATDTDNNASDFVAAAPNPRRTAPIVEIGPSVFGTDPRNNAAASPRDASLTINFTEAVDVVGSWYDITCVSTGQHNEATLSTFFGGVTHVITPNLNFQAGEQCTATIFKDQVHDVDTDDTGTNADSLPANYVWTFTVSTGTAPAYPASVHLTMGNPNGAVADLNTPDNYLMEKPEFTLSYNRSRGGANWVSWHLADEWIGSLTRVDTFRADPAIPSDWYRVQGLDYTGSGFDRGHMVPNADRDKETSIPINQATFLMSNMLPQAPDNNQGPWANLEAYLRTLLPANEIYIVAGGAGIGGTGSNGPASIIANGHVTVPAQTWKVALVIPKDSGDDVARVACGSRAIAVIMPNAQGIRTTPWENFIVPVDQVESLTGYNFFSNLPDAIEHCVEAGTNGVNPPGTADSSATTNEDTAVGITLTAASPNNAPLTYTIVTGPTHGQLSGTDGNRTYTPDLNYFGSDSFTFKVNQGTSESNTSTVSITVNSINDDPDAVDDDAIISEDSGANTINVQANDSDVDGDSRTVTAVTQGAHGSVAITNGGADVTYTPSANYFGGDSFTYTINDGNGGSDMATVNVTVNNVNDAPVAIGNSYVTNSNTTLNVAAPGVLGNDTDIDSASLTAQLVLDVSHGSLTLNANGSFSYNPSPDFEGADSFTYHANDGSADSNDVTVNITVNDTVAPVLTSSVVMTLLTDTNSNLVNVGLNASATDNSGDPVTIQVAVFGDEDDPTPTRNNVQHSPDAKDIAPVTLRLRGERVEANDGRVYLIVVTATDSSNNVTRNYHTVVVPKSNKQTNIDSVNAQAAAAVFYASNNNGTPPAGYFIIGDGPIIGPKQ